VFEPLTRGKPNFLASIKKERAGYLLEQAKETDKVLAEQARENDGGEAVWTDLYATLGNLLLNESKA